MFNSVNPIPESGLSRPSTILVVDDDPDILALCHPRLRAEGFEVLIATGSVEAQHICDIHPTKIDLIMLDVMLYPLQRLSGSSAQCHSSNPWR